MLKTTKSTTLNGTSVIKVGESDTPVVSMSASIPEQGNSNINTVIINKDLYEANKVACREDMDAFTQAVRAIEDAEEEA